VTNPSSVVFTGMIVQAVRSLEVVIIRLCEGGALPVTMSIIGPRETHDYRELNL